MPPNGNGYIYRYGFQTGIISCVTDRDAYIRLNGLSNRLIQTYQRPLDHKKLLTRISCGAQVIVSWSKSSPDGSPPAYVDPRAVERSDTWLRKEKRITAYPESAEMTGKKSETVFVDTLRAGGLRAEHATVFEDEVLHLDLWVFLYCGDTWTWIPVDLTRRPLSDGDPCGKLAAGRKHGVIPIGLPMRLLDKPGDLVPWTIAAIRRRITEFGDVTLISRQAAFMREEAIPAYR